MAKQGLFEIFGVKSENPRDSTIIFGDKST